MSKFHRGQACLTDSKLERPSWRKAKIVSKPNNWDCNTKSNSPKSALATCSTKRISRRQAAYDGVPHRGLSSVSVHLSTSTSWPS
jgi:hypothetical protein